MYGSEEYNNPLYSNPHFNFTAMVFPVNSAKNGFGFNATLYKLKLYFRYFELNYSFTRHFIIGI